MSMSITVEVAPVVTLSRAEYDAKKVIRQAGTVRDLGLGAGTVATWTERRPDWDGVYWVQGWAGGGTHLGPANVA
jgi:hypothetical protein